MISVIKSEGVSISEEEKWDIVLLFMERNGYKDRGGWWVR